MTKTSELWVKQIETAGLRRDFQFMREIAESILRDRDNIDEENARLKEGLRAAMATLEALFDNGSGDDNG